MKHLIAWSLVVAGCGSNSAKTVDAAGGDGAPSDGTAAVLTLTSTAFVEGASIPVANTCNGENSSPALSWSGVPAGTQSFAVVLTDLSLTPALVHWIIYDIPAGATALPAAVDNVYAPGNVTGAHQTTSVRANVVGYFGPCPPNPPAHNYQFAVYALDVAALPGTTASTTRPEATAQIQTHRLGSGNLTGMYTR